MEIINNRGVWLDYKLCAAAAYHAVPKDKACLLAYKKAKNKEHFRTAHESDLILYEAAAKVIGFALIGGRLPSVAALQAEYAKLNEQKETIYAGYVKFKKQVKEYDKIKRNINDFLKIDRGQSKKKLRQDNDLSNFVCLCFSCGKINYDSNRSVIIIESKRKEKSAMKRVKRTKKEAKENNIKNRAYSSLFSIVSFIVSFAYILVDVICGVFFDAISEKYNIPAIASLVILVIAAITCHISVKKLRNGIESDYKKMRKLCNALESYAQEIGYLSYILLGATLLVAVYLK